MQDVHIVLEVMHFSLRLTPESRSGTSNDISVLLQYPAPWKDLPPETKGMVKRMSGRVSGLLDDLTDAMSLLHDLMPSKDSELVSTASLLNISLQC